MDVSGDETMVWAVGEEDVIPGEGVDDTEDYERTLEMELFHSASTRFPIFSGGMDMEDAEEDMEEEDDKEEVSSDDEDEDEDEEEEEERKRGKEGEGDASKEAVWEDSDDENVQIDISSVNRLRKLRETEDEHYISGREYAVRLRRQFTRVHQHGLQWAQLDSERRDEDEILLHNMHSVTQKGSSIKLRPTLLDVIRVRDANLLDPSSAVVQSIEFHPSGEVLAVGSFDKHVRLFGVDGSDRPPKLHSILLRDMPVTKTSFFPDGQELLIGGRRPFYYSFDVMTGKLTRYHGILGASVTKSYDNFVVSPDNDTVCFLGSTGNMSLLSRRTRECIGNLKMNDTVRACCFSHVDGGRRLISTGSMGEVCIWDVRMHRLVHKFIDQGSLKSSVIALSNDDLLLATGSNSGVVSLYEMSEIERIPSGMPVSPQKEFMNLTTTIHGLSFNHDGQMLLMSSRFHKGSIRLVHTASRTVFRNWPDAHSPLKYVSSTAFSPHSGYLAIGNDKGKVNLFRLRAYPSS
eukprot:TRINITY_DN31518_c0_g1_i1.p1 TRINITY_DN31518_c0_g1~~TRINITY_DN31518_c0_g1_i1.p1  ORF type:complete len:562 (+),score=146.97 TRINITY_DN31518_c0_g1_i1:135-1688(+)